MVVTAWIHFIRRKYISLSCLSNIDRPITLNLFQTTRFESLILENISTVLLKISIEALHENFSFMISLIHARYLRTTNQRKDNLWNVCVACLAPFVICSFNYRCTPRLIVTPTPHRIPTRLLSVYYANDVYCTDRLKIWKRGTISIYQ